MELCIFVGKLLVGLGVILIITSVFSSTEESFTLEGIKYLLLGGVLQGVPMLIQLLTTE